MTVELQAYQQNIISFLRVHRAVAGGISAAATAHFEKLSKYEHHLDFYLLKQSTNGILRCLAPLHNLTFATPSLIALATRKIYSHRIHIVRPERERSMQWGSDVDAVAALLKGIGPEDVIEDVLGNSGAEAPL